MEAEAVKRKLMEAEGEAEAVKAQQPVAEVELLEAALFREVEAVMKKLMEAEVEEVKKNQWKRKWKR